MKTQLPILILASMALFLVPAGVSAQGMAEMKGLGALSAGAGAGAAAALAGSKKNPKNASYNSGMALSNTSIEKVLQEAQKLEKEKKWSEAEKYYRSGLTGLSNAGKFDSPQRVPLLEGIASACMAQKKTNEAAGYYKTVVALHEKRLGEADPATINAKQRLADIFVADGDYNNAATYLGQAVASAEKAESRVSAKQQITLLNCYSTVLRELGRDNEAADIEAKAGTIRSAGGTAATPTSASK